MSCCVQDAVTEKFRKLRQAEGGSGEFYTWDKEKEGDSGTQGEKGNLTIGIARKGKVGGRGGGGRETSEARGEGECAHGETESRHPR